MTLTRVFSGTVPHASSRNSRFQAWSAVSFSSTNPPAMAHVPGWSLRSMRITSSPLPSSRSRITSASAAWFGPHLPSKPRPVMPVRPAGFRGRFVPKSSRTFPCTRSALE